MLKKLILLLGLGSALGGQPVQTVQDAIVADALADTAGHDFLTKLCDDFGGRLTGAPGNNGALDRTLAELKTLGVEARLEKFKMPGWVRGQDEVMMLAPVARPLRVAALSYTQPHAKFEAEVVDIGQGRDEDFAKLDAKGKVGLLAPFTTVSRGQYEKAAMAHGLRGILFTNRVAGGQLLARTGSFAGEPLRIPVYSITQEEGNWIGRLLKRGETVRISMLTRSYCEEIETANIVATFPGRTADTVVIGAHFDSWDLGQGAMDNGIGTAQLYAIAKVLQAHAPQNERTIEMVWFNGEEQGLWGSRIHAPTLKDRPVAAMINLDMVGYPVSVNSLGYDDLVPLLERYNDSLGDHKLKQGVGNINWFGSDHTSFQLEGIRSITFGGIIPPESVRYYHDMADTIDKVEPKLIADSTAVIAALVYRLANEPGLPTDRLPPAAVEAVFRKFDLQKRMRGAGLWPFGDEPATVPIEK
ncbi:MAG: M28 family peptidase [Opitutaceae bacterium]|nr:M28 family peptidase [Opitutaceae bacterium]MBP9913367.1 M28 family peptidase [Opitutaceae bacterium]